MKHAILFVIFAFNVSSICLADKPLSKVERAAIAKYDDLADDWKTKAVAAWKSELASAKGDTKRLKELLKNDPPYFPPMYPAAVLINGPQIEKGDWGHVNQMNGFGGILVERVIDKTRALCRCADTYLVIEGIDTSQMADKNVYRMSGAFHFDGTTEKIGGMTVVVFKPIEKVPKKQDKPVK